MPTLEELFKSKTFLEYNNQTAAQYNDVRDYKSIPIQSLDLGVDKFGSGELNKLRSKKSERLFENAFEEEEIGLSAYRNAAAVPLYGTNILRIDSQTTPLVTSMRTLNNIGVGGNVFTQAATAVAGDIAASGVKAGLQSALGLPNTFSAKSVLTSAGAKLSNALISLTPDVLIPSKVINIIYPPLGIGRLASSLYGNVTSEFPNAPSNLEIIAKAGQIGNVGSKLLSSAQGTSEQARNSLISAGLSIAEEKAKDLVKKGITNLLKKRQSEAAESTQTNGDSLIDAWGKIIYTPSRKYYSENSKVDSLGKRPLRILNPSAENVKDRGDLSTLLANASGSTAFNGHYPPIKSKKYPNTTPTPLDQIKFNDDTKAIKYSKLKNSKDGYGMEVKRGIGTERVRLNHYLPYIPDDVTNYSKKLKAGGIVDDLDLIPLKFYSIANNVVVNFVSTITGLTETYTPTWDSSKFVGSPFNIYTYNSIERSVQFNFKVFSLSPREHINAWKKLAFLSSLVYPQKYIGDANAVVPPFIKFTLGDMYYNKEGFIESLIYTIDDNTTWETGIDPDISVKNYRLPKIIDVGITIKMVENKNSTYDEIPISKKIGDYIDLGGNLYGYRSPTNEKGEVIVSTESQDKIDGDVTSKNVPEIEAKKETANLPPEEKLDTKPKRKVEPNPEIAAILLKKGYIKHGASLYKNGYPVYLYKGKQYYEDGTETKGIFTDG
jgi:hypothetical protein